MSSDYRPSFRAALKGKINKVFKSNITSFRERVISNDTYYNLREKSRNLTDTVKERTPIGSFINKTKEYIPGAFRKDNETISKGFYDSIFNAESPDDVYLKAAVICLWTIAILFIIPTIITIFIPVRRKPIKTTGVKMIFFHIFLCELCYLIYLFLSMINVAMNYKLNSIACDIANYGMYATIPIMYIALLFLSIERITTHCTATGTWIKIFTKAWITQLILIFIWILLIAVIVTVMFIKKQFSTLNALKKAKTILSTNFGGNIDKFIPVYRCSVDGRLSSIFKVLFIVLFVILIVLIIKAMAISIAYKFSASECCAGRKKNSKTEQANRHITLVFAIFLFLNLFFSFPFYGVSMADSILRHFISSKDKFTTKLKLCFILRLISIILQCLVYYTFESKSWYFLRSILNKTTCEKLIILKDNDNDVTKRRQTTRDSDSSDIDIKWEKNKQALNKRTANGKKPTTDTKSRTTDRLKNGTSSRTTKKISPIVFDSDNTSEEEKKQTVTTKERKSNRSNKNTNETIGKIAVTGINVEHDSNGITNHEPEDDDDEVFITDSENKPPSPKKPERTIKDTSNPDDSDDNTTIQQKPKLSTPKKESASITCRKTAEDEEKTPLKRSTSKPTSPNGVSKQTPNGKSVSQRISSKTKLEQNNTKRESSSSLLLSSSSSSEEEEESDVEIKPTTPTYSNKQNRIKTDLSNGNSSHHQTKYTQSNNQTHQKPSQKPNHRRKKDRLKQIYDTSDAV